MHQLISHFIFSARLFWLLMDILFPVYPVSPDRWTMVDAHAMEIEYSYARYGFPIPGPARAARDRMSAAPPPRVGRREKMANFDAQPRPRS